MMLISPAREGGANGLCLIDAQQNFITHGAKEERYKDKVHEPAGARRDPNWWPLSVPKDDIEERKKLSELADCSEPYYWRDPKGHMIKEKYWPSTG